LQPERSYLEPLYLEPSAGNGLLTIALPYHQTYVNELDDVRLSNLKDQPFAKVSSWDALKPPFAYDRKFDGVVTNPPFGSLAEPILFGNFRIKRMEHAMCLAALRCMKDNGRAAIIIGGHTTWDGQGRVTAGHNRIFLNYLYHFYNVDDIIPINGKKLYSRQGTSINTRLILINGAKQKPEGAAPLKNKLHATAVNTHEELWERVGLDNNNTSDMTKMKLRAKAIMLKQKQQSLGGLRARKDEYWTEIKGDIILVKKLPNGMIEYDNYHKGKVRNIRAKSELFKRKADANKYFKHS